MPRRNDERDRAAAASGTHKAGGPFTNRQIGAVARGLLTGFDIDTVSTVPAPSTQQQIRFRRGTERCRPRGAFEALAPLPAAVRGVGHRDAAPRYRRWSGSFR